MNPVKIPSRWSYIVYWYVKKWNSLGWSFSRVVYVLGFTLLDMSEWANSKCMDFFFRLSLEVLMTSLFGIFDTHWFIAFRSSSTVTVITDPSATTILISCTICLSWVWKEMQPVCMVRLVCGTRKVTGLPQLQKMSYGRAPFVTSLASHFHWLFARCLTCIHVLMLLLLSFVTLLLLLYLRS